MVLKGFRLGVLEGFETVRGLSGFRGLSEGSASAGEVLSIAIMALMLVLAASEYLGEVFLGGTGSGRR